MALHIRNARPFLVFALPAYVTPGLSWSLLYIFLGLCLASYLTYRYCANKYNYRYDIYSATLS